jgi:uncharacterized protein YjbK
MSGKEPDTPRSMESELKLELDASTYLALMALRAAGDEPVEQINTFYDSAAGDLRRLERALRLRRESGRSGVRAFLTVKGSAVRREGGFFVRPEEEVEISAAEAARLAGGFRFSQCPHAPVRELLAAAGDLEVVPFCAFVNYRTRVRAGGWTFDLDRTLIGASVSHELEMEGEGEGRDLQQWLRSRGWAFRPATRSKLAAALAAAEAFAAAGGAAAPGRRTGPAPASGEA